jgi:dTDP-4-dehydrorhamnose reductase
MASSSSNEADILVVGGDSMIGAAIATAAGALGLRVIATTRRSTPGMAQLDLADPKKWDWLEGVRARTAVLAAAVARLDACHLDPEASSRVNVTGTVELGRRLAARGTHLIHLSTNQVFSGETPSPAEDAPLSPANVYGRQKADAEAGLLSLGPTATVLRLTKVIHPGMALFQGWADALAEGRMVRPARDMALAPVTVDLVVQAVLALAKLGWAAPERTAGIFHLSAADEISYADAALVVARRLGADPALVRPVDSVAAGYVREQPPRHTIMACGRLRSVTGIAPPGAAAALAACLPVMTGSAA